MFLRTTWRDAPFLLEPRGVLVASPPYGKRGRRAMNVPNTPTAIGVNVRPTRVRCAVADGTGPPRTNTGRTDQRKAWSWAREPSRVRWGEASVLHASLQRTTPAAG